MQVKLGDLRKMIREEYMRGVPEFILKEATKTYVGAVRKHVQRHILMTRKSPADARAAIDAANEMLLQLEEEANQLLEDKLWQFMQKL